MLKRILPPSFFNAISLIGASLVGISFGLIVFLMVLGIFDTHSKPYMGIITFILLPFVLVVGFAIIMVGMILDRRRRLRTGDVSTHLPSIDLNNPRHRRNFGFIAFVALALIISTGFASYQAYEYTESDTFCGTTCHVVMEPEYTAYQFSPHAKVGCVQCHIGSGADYFVKSKLSGSYQLYSVTFNKYSRPIATPIHNLRPAQETCEQCHWPKHFFSEKLLKNTYFLSNKENTRWDLDLLIKIGGGNIEAGPTSGIHWHMNIGHQVTYATLDSTRQTIPWVKVKDPNGNERVYTSDENPLKKEDFDKAEVRRMDCIDCHNRPTHIYRPPSKTVNTAMSLGWIDPELPDVKALSVNVLDNPYSAKNIALDSIKTAVEEYYKAKYPDIAVQKKESIQKTIDELQKIYSRNYFPAMQVSWKKFPDNIGHLYYPGCFRCHDGKHKSSEGKVLSRECNVCHTLLSQQFEKDKLRLSLSGVEYQHPVDIGDAWKEMNCSECHNPK
ncbi:MAG: NapC/NirT family cytochrome c [Bacteroidota bacterium]|nr:NapC/NirT family cytochrome c [Bacteroidota bacterium]